MAAGKPTAVPAGAKRSMRGPERRAQLLAVARRVFGRGGFHGVSMDEVAKNAQFIAPNPRLVAPGGGRLIQALPSPESTVMFLPGEFLSRAIACLNAALSLARKSCEFLHTSYTSPCDRTSFCISLTFLAKARSADDFDDVSASCQYPANGA